MSGTVESTEDDRLMQPPDFVKKTATSTSTEVCADEAIKVPTFSGGGYQLQSKRKAVDLHYDALAPNATIDADHVNKIMGYKIKNNKEREETILNWKLWKKDVRGWAAYHIKDRISNEAQKIKPDDEMMARPTFNGKSITKFNEYQKWWATAPASCSKSVATFTYLSYDMWEKSWEKIWEKKFMEMCGWSYDEKIKADIQKRCNRDGYEMKGCISKNIKQVKGEIVKGLQKKGRLQGHGTTVKRRRNKEEAYMGNKYIRCKRVTVKVEPEKGAKAKTEEEVAPTKMNNEEINEEGMVQATATTEMKANKKKGKKQMVQATALDKERVEVAAAADDLSIDIIDNHVIISQKASPATPAYEPSEYELYRLEKIRKNKEYMDSKYPPLTVQNEAPKKVAAKRRGKKEKVVSYC